MSSNQCFFLLLLYLLLGQAIIAIGNTPNTNFASSPNEYAIAATGDTRNGATSNATGAADGTTTEIGSSSDYLVLTLANELPIGTTYTIYICLLYTSPSPRDRG